MKTLYSVLEREKLCDIAKKKHNISVKELAEYNGLNESDVIKPGDLLHIPSRKDK